MGFKSTLDECIQSHVHQTVGCMCSLTDSAHYCLFSSSTWLAVFSPMLSFAMLPFCYLLDPQSACSDASAAHAEHTDFHNLPPEVLVHTLRCLDSASIARAAQASRALRKAAEAARSSISVACLTPSKLHSVTQYLGTSGKHITSLVLSGNQRTFYRPGHVSVQLLELPASCNKGCQAAAACAGGRCTHSSSSSNSSSQVWGPCRFEQPTAPGDQQHREWQDARQHPVSAHKTHTL